MDVNNKIRSLDKIIHIVSQLKKKRKKVVLSHGIFDIIHPGIIKHLKSAKKQGDVLVVSVIRNEDVRKGPGRPIFDEKLRLENVASLKFVDYVALVEGDGSSFAISRIKPDVFARGQDYKEREPDIVKKVDEEEKAIKDIGSEIRLTGGFTASSTDIINKFLNMYSEDTRNYLKEFSRKYNSKNVVEALRQFKDLKVMIIGDAIIDEYCYTEAMGKSAKEPLVVSRYLYKESYAGGSFAVANHIAGICGNIEIVTDLGIADSKEEFVLDKLAENIEPRFFFRKNSPTTVKTRYIDEYLNKKLFEINYISNTRISKTLEKQVAEYIEKEIPKFDLVLVADFGHGFMTDNLISLIEKKSKILAVNSQTNGSNRGFNFITKYQNVNFICLDEAEARLSCQDRYSDIKDVVKKLAAEVNTEYMIVTRGSQGSLGYSPESGFNETPAFALRVIDRIGAGDAFFSFTAPCFAKKMPLDFVSFIGNAVGAIAVQIVGNKKPVKPQELYEFIYALLS